MDLSPPTGKLGVPFCTIGSKYENVQTLTFSFCESVTTKLKDIDSTTKIESFQIEVTIKWLRPFREAFVGPNKIEKRPGNCTFADESGKFLGSTSNELIDEQNDGETWRPGRY